MVLTGDVHRNYVMDLKADYDDADSATVGAEFAGTSLTSGSDGVDDDGSLDVRYAANPHLHWASLQRGYVRCHLDEDVLQVDYREVSYVTTPGAPVLRVPRSWSKLELRESRTPDRKVCPDRTVPPATVATLRVLLAVSPAGNPVVHQSRPHHDESSR